MGTTKKAKEARRELKRLGITEDDPRYQPKMMVTRVETMAASKARSLGMIPTLQGDHKTQFVNVPVLEMMNPYRRLLKAMMSGTYCERLRLEIEAQVAKELPLEPQEF